MTWPFDPLVPLAYGGIVADPPWGYVNWSAAGQQKSPTRHYHVMTLAELKAMPVGHLAAPNCLLWLWATAPMLPQALELMAAWGFRYVTMGVWAKRGRADGGWQFGTGYVLRSAAEPYLIGAIGKPEVTTRSERNLVVAPVREHSRKPEAAYESFKRMTRWTRRCELFGRERRTDFEGWGDQIERFGVVHGQG